MKIEKSSLYAIFSSIIVCIFSLIVLPLYTEGDQQFYKKFYEGCLDDYLILNQQFLCYQSTVGSQEPIYFILAKLASIFLNKDVFISLSNAILTFLLIKVILKYYQPDYSRFFFILLFLTNFYFLVILFSAERLKFSLFFVVLSFLFYGYKNLLFLFFSLFTHIQSVFLLASYFVFQVFNNENSFFKKTLLIFGFIFMFTCVFFILNTHFEAKFLAFYGATAEEDKGFVGVLKTSFLIILGCISVRKIAPFIFGLPIILSSFLLGPARLVMLAFILYLCTILYYKGKMDVALFIVMLYFSFKSIEFVSNILKYGSGFL